MNTRQISDVFGAIRILFGEEIQWIIEWGPIIFCFFVLVSDIPRVVKLIKYEIWVKTEKRDQKGEKCLQKKKSSAQKT